MHRPGKPGAEGFDEILGDVVDGDDAAVLDEDPADGAAAQSPDTSAPAISTFDFVVDLTLKN